MNPLFPLCVCFAPFRRCHSLPSARLPISIFHRFCPFLERMKTDEVNPEILLVHCVLLAYVFCPSASETGAYIRSMFTFFVLETTRFFNVLYPLCICQCSGTGPLRLHPLGTRKSSGTGALAKLLKLFIEISEVCDY